MNRIKGYFLRNRAQILITSLILLFLFLFLWPRIFYVVGPGETGVKYSLFFGGTVTERVYGEGLKAIFPWDRMYIYDVRVQEVRKDLNVLTNQGLMIHLELSIRYHPERDLVGILHKKVGPDYVERIVVPEVESVLRTNIGKMTAEEVYTTQLQILERIMENALEEVVQRFVKLDDVIIRRIELPDFVRTAIEAKLEQKELARAYEYRLKRETQEARRKEIEAGGFKAYNEIVNSSLTPEILQWKGIEVSKELAASENAKIIVIGNGPDGLPIILGAGN
jgi:regulator of protease activity HflC (stomatin/prohibitin superfamily)